MTDVTAGRLRLTDFVPAGGVMVQPEDVWSCGEPDAQGRVRAIVRVGDALLRVEGRRVFEIRQEGDGHVE